MGFPECDEQVVSLNLYGCFVHLCDYHGFLGKGFQTLGVLHYFETYWMGNISL